MVRCEGLAVDAIGQTSVLDSFAKAGIGRAAGSPMSPIPGHGGWTPRRSRAVVRKCGHRWCCAVGAGCWLRTHGQSTGCPAVFRKTLGSRRKGILLVGVPFFLCRTGPQGGILMSLKNHSFGIWWICGQFRGLLGSWNQLFVLLVTMWLAMPRSFPSRRNLGLVGQRLGETRWDSEGCTVAAPGGGLGLAAESDSKRIVAMSWKLSWCSNFQLSELFACSRTSHFGCLELASSDPSSWLLCFERLCQHSQATSPSSPRRADGGDADATLGGNHRCLRGGLF